jgi:hypothetical protein
LRQVNPRLVYISVSGSAQGPHATCPGQARSRKALGGIARRIRRPTSRARGSAGLSRCRRDLPSTPRRGTRGAHPTRRPPASARRSLYTLGGGSADGLDHNDSDGQPDRPQGGPHHRPTPAPQPRASQRPRRQAPGCSADGAWVARTDDRPSWLWALGRASGDLGMVTHQMTARHPAARTR